MKYTLNLPALFALFVSLLVCSLASAQKSTLPGDDLEYKVVINHEGQYAIIPKAKRTRTGWENTGKLGDLATCQKYIEEVWTDMRPLSVRNQNLPPDTRYQVVINREEMYAIVPAGQKMKKNWEAIGKEGSLEACMDYIEEVWTDMRPLSVRKQLGKS